MPLADLDGSVFGQVLADQHWHKVEDELAAYINC